MGKDIKMSVKTEDDVDDVSGEDLGYSNGLRFRECEPTWGGRLERGLCHGCKRDAMLPVGADPDVRRCIKCIMGRRASPQSKRVTKRRQYHRYAKCLEPDCSTMVVVRKNTTGYCMKHARRRRAKQGLSTRLEIGKISAT